MVEDELSLAMVVSDNLQSAGYRVTHARDGEEGLKAFFRLAPDLVILDVMMPKVDGFSVAKSIRETDRSTPILFLTAKVNVKDVVKGFEAGGNDYIRKPFSIEELLIRIKVILNENRLLERPKPVAAHIFEIGQYSFDSRKFELTLGGNVRKLTVRESDLLKLFCENREETLTKQHLLLKVWQDDSFINSRSLDVFVSRLRKYMKQDAMVSIINIRGVGYKLMVLQ